MNHPFFDAYELLEISPNATSTEIKKAYKKKSLEYHPDKHSNSKPSNTMFRIITRCKEILLDPKKRLEHDYALGFKKKPAPNIERETIYIDRVETETSWGAVIGVGVAGVLLGIPSRERSENKPQSTEKMRFIKKWAYLKNNHFFTTFYARSRLIVNRSIITINWTLIR